jgi:hypothetical protein
MNTKYKFNSNILGKKPCICQQSQQLHSDKDLYKKICHCINSIDIIPQLTRQTNYISVSQQPFYMTRQYTEPLPIASRSQSITRQYTEPLPILSYSYLTNEHSKPLSLSPPFISPILNKQ